MTRAERLLKIKRDLAELRARMGRIDHETFSAKRELMALLNMDGVSALSMFPGYAGAAKHVVEGIQCNAPGRHYL